jgi:hypothetical protein
MASLIAVDSNAVRQETIDAVERFRLTLRIHMAVSRRDAFYVVECLRILLQQAIIAQTMLLWLQNDDISDEAIDVFAGFLRETTPPCHLPCHLHSLLLLSLPSQQIRRLLEAFANQPIRQGARYFRSSRYQRSFMDCRRVTAQDRLYTILSSICLTLSVYGYPPLAAWTICLEHTGTW